MTHHEHDGEHDAETATGELTEEAERAARDAVPDDGPDGPRPKKGDPLTTNTEAQESTGEDA